MSEQETYELFDAYLRGELSGQELDAFVQRLQTDAEFKSALDLHVLLVKGIEEHRRQELKSFLKEETKRSFMGNPFGAKYTWFAAAVLAFFALVYVGFEFGLQEEIAQLKEYRKPADSARKQKKEQSKAEEIEPGNASTLEETPPAPETQLSEADDMEMQDKDQVKGAYLGESESDVEEIDVAVLDQVESAKSLVSEDENTLPVKQDTKLYDTQMVVNQIAWSTDSLVSSSGKPLSNKALPNVKREKAVKEKSDKKITIEFWGSPINYKGYRFDGRKLVLFGQDEQSDVHVVAVLTDANLGVYRYFFKLQGAYYELFDDNAFRSYKPVTDSRILTKLP